MKKIYFTLLVALFAGFTTKAQLNFNFTAKDGMYTNLVGATRVTVVADRDSVENNDDGYFNNIPIGFTFNYNGANFSDISANTNGFASFLPFTPIADLATRDYYTPNLTDNDIRPVLAPLWDDHDMFGEDGISYKTEGTAPNRVFTLQWDSVYWDLTVEGPNPTMSFQIKLYETSNVIQFLYKQLAGPVAAGAAASIGITGSASGQFISLNNTSISPSASSIEDVFTLNQKPLTGQVYEFTPVAVWYSKSTGDLTMLSNWNSLPDGTGASSPSSFSGYDQQFIINRAGTIDLGPADTIKMGGQLILEGGVDLITNGRLVFKSFATHTGRLGPVPNNSSISGDVTVERYMTALSNRAFRLVGPSVNTPASLFSNWQENGDSIVSSQNPAITYGTHITGDSLGRNGLDATGTGQPSLFKYNSTTNRYDTVTTTVDPVVAPVNTTQGYIVFVRGDRDRRHLASIGNSSDAILRAKGSLSLGDVSFPNIAGNQSFTLVTNPYISPINWSKIYNDISTTHSTNLEKFYYYLDPNIGDRGSYVTVDTDGLQSVPGARGTIQLQSGSAFFVVSKVGAPTSTFTVKEAHKDLQANVNVFRSSTVMFGVSLYYNDATRGRRMADGATAVFQEGYSASVDGNDAVKFPNFDEGLGFTRLSNTLSIESRPLINSKDTLFLTLSKLKAQKYELQFSPGSFGDPGLVASLKDNYLGTMTPINLNGTSIISFEVDKNPGSYASDRFYITFSSGTALPLEMTDVKGYQKSSGIQIDWKTASESNMNHYEVEKSVNGQQFDKVGSVASKGNSSSVNMYDWFDANPVNGVNYYRIRSVSKSGSFEFSQIIKVTISNGKQIVSVYPNPVQNGLVNLQLNNLEKGNYTVSVVNNLGQQVYNKFINHPGGVIAYKLQLGTGLSHGLYQLKLFGNGQRIAQQILLQGK